MLKAFPQRARQIAQQAGQCRVVARGRVGKQPRVRQQLAGPQAVAQVLCHQHLSQQLEPDKGDRTGILLAVGVAIAQPPPDVVMLDELVARKMGFESTYPLTAQTYSRKVDAQFADSWSRADTWIRGSMF